MPENIPIRTKPEPACPDCGARMVLRRPRPGTNQTWRPFWGCSTYPDCHGKRNIKDTGEAESDDDIDDRDSDGIEGYTHDDWHPGHPNNYGDR